MMTAMIRAALADIDAAGSFIYGSVARGTTTPASDIDVMVLLRCELDERERDTVRERFRELQTKLGFRPHPKFPVELFTIDDARAALDADQPDEDQREIRHALNDQKIIVLDSPELTELIARSGAPA